MNGEENLSNRMLNKVEDFFVPIKTRLSNSWVVSFAIAWVIINWQPILYVILAKEPILERFVYVEETYYNSFGANWWFYFLLPLLIGAFYAFVFPFIEPGMEWATLYQRRLTNDRNHDLLMNDLVNQEKLSLKKAKVAKIEELQDIISSHELTIRSQDKEIEDLKDKFDKESARVTEEIDKSKKLDIENVRLKNEIKAEKQKIENFQNQIDVRDIQINDLNGELNKLRISLQEELQKGNKIRDQYFNETIKTDGLKSDVDYLKKDKERLEVQISEQLERLQQLNQIEALIPEMELFLASISSNFPGIKSPVLEKGQTTDNFISNSIRFISKINESINTSEKKISRFKFKLNINPNKKTDEHVRRFFNVANDLEINIIDMDFIGNNTVELEVESHDSNTIQKIISAGTDYWSKI